MTIERMNFLKPLLLEQSYITSVEWHDGEKIDVDFTKFRSQLAKNATIASGMAMYVKAFETRYDKPWISLRNVKKHNRPVINRTSRYHNPGGPSIYRAAMRAGKALFIGLPEEHTAFEAEFGKIEYRPVKDALEMAHVIAGSSIYVSSQSLAHTIAEAMKHPLILEQRLNCPHCVFPRPSATYVTQSREFEIEHRFGRLMLALQFTDKDYDRALDLAGVIAGIENKERRDVDFSILYTKKISQREADAVAAILKPKFKNVFMIQSTRNGEGWPHGPNDLWQDGMRQLSDLHRSGKTRCDGVFTFEPDCAPLRTDWIDVLQGEWMNCLTQGKLCIGWVTQPPDRFLHINGNGIFHIDITANHPKLNGSSAREGWDTFHGKFLWERSVNSDFIENFYKCSEYLTPEKLASVRRNGEIPAILHGLKTDCGLRYAETLIR